MNLNEIQRPHRDLRSPKIDMYRKDFLLTWEKSRDELDATFLVADILRAMRDGEHQPQDLGLRHRRLQLPGQLHPHPLLLRQRLPTSWASMSRTWTRARARSPTARPSARPPT